MLTIEELRTRIGLVATDVSKDAQLTDCYSMALAIVEDYLDRKLLRATYTETFFETRSALLKAWPVDSITTVDGKTPDVNLIVDWDLGVIRKVCWDKILVEYVGGYLPDELPLPLVLAINGVFDQLWFAVPGWGLVKAQAQAAGEVKRFSINGISVEYFQSSDGSASSGSGGASSFIPAAMSGIIDRYKRESLMGGC